MPLCSAICHFPEWLRLRDGAQDGQLGRRWRAEPTRYSASAADRVIPTGARRRPTPSTSARRSSAASRQSAAACARVRRRRQDPSPDAAASAFQSCRAFAPCVYLLPRRAQPDSRQDVDPSTSPSSLTVAAADLGVMTICHPCTLWRPPRCSSRPLSRSTCIWRSRSAQRWSARTVLAVGVVAWEKGSAHARRWSTCSTGRTTSNSVPSTRGMLASVGAPFVMRSARPL